MKTIFRLLILTLFLFNSVFILVAQSDLNRLKQFPKGQMVSYSENTSFCDVIDYVEFLYQKYDNKNIVVNSNCRFPIGIELNNVLYKNALQEICNLNNLNLRVTQSQIEISEQKNIREQLSDENQLFEKRQVKISAILFEANLDKLKESGVDWDYVIAKHGLESSGGFSSLGGTEGNFGVKTAGDFGKFTGYTSAIFKFLESENLGKIVSKMTVVVNDGQKSKMQVGSDISIKQLDFAGNVTDAFFPTGTIINVEPTVIIKDTLEITKLKIHVERSASFPENENREINRTYTNTEVLLKNKEEMIIGSLLVDEEITLRKGIPVLKDLPWWVLGLRYLTGYDSKIAVHKEVVILVSAELLPTISDRLNGNTRLIKDRVDNDSSELNKLIQETKSDNDDQ